MVLVVADVSFYKCDKDEMIVPIILILLLVTINNANLNNFGYNNDGNDLVTLVGYWLDQWR